MSVFSLEETARDIVPKDGVAPTTCLQQRKSEITTGTQHACGILKPRCARAVVEEVFLQNLEKHFEQIPSEVLVVKAI